MFISIIWLDEGLMLQFCKYAWSFSGIHYQERTILVTLLNRWSSFCTFTNHRDYLSNTQFTKDHRCKYGRHIFL